MSMLRRFPKPQLGINLPNLVRGHGDFSPIRGPGCLLKGVALTISNDMNELSCGRRRTRSNEENTAPIPTR